MASKLTDAQRETALAELNGWVYHPDEDAIEHVFKFKSFSEAFGFMARVALAAQSGDHHPDWSNSYDTVTIRLSTHDAGGLSQKDIDLAKDIDALLI